MQTNKQKIIDGLQTAFVKLSLSCWLLKITFKYNHAAYSLQVIALAQAITIFP